MDTDYVELPVTGGFKTKVDPDIAVKLINKRIFLDCDKRPSFYENKKDIYISRFVMNAPHGMIVDHLNGDTFDNRRINLRVCSISENNRNIHVKRFNKTFFTGVSNFRKKFRSRTCANSRQVFLGLYFSSLVAGLFRDSYVFDNFGCYSGLNFPENISSDSLSSFLENTKGKIFRCWFVKRKDGSIRSILCRTGVHKDLKNKGLAYNHSEKNLMLVYDLNFHNYRFIPMENILCLKFKNLNYKVNRPRLSLAA